MKKILFSLTLLISSFSFGQTINLADVKNPTIKAFLMALDGTEATAEKVVARTCSQEVIDNGMIPMGRLKVVYYEEGNCVQFTTLWIVDADDKEESMEEMDYEICEENGKIVAFDLVFDDEEEEEE